MCNTSVSIRRTTKIRSQFYIRGLSEKLRRYIADCPNCLAHQTKRHKPWGTSNPLDSAQMPFQCIDIDFIVNLPESSKQNNACMCVTCQLSKNVALLPGKVTDTPEIWAVRRLSFLMVTGWMGSPIQYRADRDRKFIADVCNAEFCATWIGSISLVGNFGLRKPISRSVFLSFPLSTTKLTYLKGLFEKESLKRPLKRHHMSPYAAHYSSPCIHKARKKR